MTLPTRASIRAAAACVALWIAGTNVASAADVFTLTSPAFVDNGMLATANGGNVAGNPNCTGTNISPPLAWSGAPRDTRSFALVLFDPEGRAGLGSTHFVGYGIAPSVGAFAEGALIDTGRGFTGGKTSSGSSVYSGPCPPPGTGLHHYVFTLIATDLEPNALPAGLTREQMLDALNGHAKAVAGTIARLGK